MARTKQTVLNDQRSAQQAAAAAGRGVCKCGPINIRAARIMSSQEVAALPPVKTARSSQSEEYWDTDDDEVRTPPCSTALPLIDISALSCACAAIYCMHAGLLGVVLNVEHPSVGGSCSLRVCLRESPALGRSGRGAG